MATSTKRAMVFLIMMASIGACFSVNYKVGDSLGWTNETTPDYYKKWSSSKTFFVGDTFNFQYNYNLSDVMQVSSEDFVACNPRNPLNIYESGADNFTLSSPGHYFYICTKGNRCKQGQKVDLMVYPDSNSSSKPPSSPVPVPRSSPTPRPSPTPASPHQPSTPSPSSIPAAPRGPLRLPTPSSSVATPPDQPSPVAAPGSSQNSVSSLASSSGLFFLQLLVALGLFAQ